ncbi:hypothetical protein COV61_04725 [Candidatus Micrarchaeota archaeon CG11_big_fil_rev_8_21_14_0_20_47_5]|nr:MAG: hypothetical protein AUJ17_00205 [Candidatus Micrarchaeota archaeon CG1_02_47_40]PIN82868.1 MAG: hypothetical protein COV61_04725 [Candidatus Micrarchaeota archaeon CG11_big_fil_rev_8_21_14_0_20_47_5]
MRVVLSDAAEEDIKAFDKQLKQFLKAHLIKISQMPPRRHLKHGLPFFVEEVTKQARFVYREEEDSFLVLRCFATHKEYERWHQWFK